MGRALPLGPLGRQREVDHHDRVLLHDPDEQDDADERDDAEIHPADQEGQHGPEAGGRQGREDRDGMDVALVQDSQHDVDGRQRHRDEEGL